MLTQTDSYKGYVFPAGTMFLANAWGIHHDESEYLEPDAFNPDRWLNNKYGTRTAKDAAGNDTNNEDAATEQRKMTYSWGAGRRICPGQKLAENSLQMVMAKLVWAFDIEKEEDNIDTSPLSAYQGGFVIAPKKFPARIRPRSEKHADIIKKEFLSMEPFFEKFEKL
jgi:cytochrome P450